MYKRSFVDTLANGIKTRPDYIHVVLGPRQVGKTTGVLQLIKTHESKAKYISADGDLLKPSFWLLEQWTEFQSTHPKSGLLIIDEIQKVENWSESIKLIWDEQHRSSSAFNHQLILLGSSSLELQQGLSESLVGRYILYPVRHWTFEESQKAFGLTLPEYLRFGGYPASYSFLKNSKHEWLNYLHNSIINPVIGRDILSTRKVKSPSLFKQCFDIACSYAAQELSYTKLLGQLQEKGNTELVKHYLELFESAFLLKQLFKYSNKKTLSKSSSPKLLPLCPALYSITLDADLSDAELGRSFELIIGCMLNSLPGNLFYWRDGLYEVDYILKYGKKLLAIEVKWGNSRSTKGLEIFKNKHPSAQLFVVTKENFGEVVKQVHSKILHE